MDIATAVMPTSSHGAHMEYILTIAGQQIIKCYDYDEYLSVHHLLSLLGLRTVWRHDELFATKKTSRMYMELLRDE